MRLPVIVGFGGVNTAGRSSGHHAYRRLVYSSLSKRTQASTRSALGQLMGLAGDSAAQDATMLAHTLIRRIEPAWFDPEAVLWHQRLRVIAGGGATRVTVARRHLPSCLPPGTIVHDTGLADVVLELLPGCEVLLPTTSELPVHSAGLLPSGFDPGTLYASRHHPRGLQMTIYAASDALASLGLEWEQVASCLPPDQVSVYVGSAMGQLDEPGSAGMLNARTRGQRTSSKSCPLGLAEMPSDFINAYVLGTMGGTGTNLGACASFLYNLRQGISDIQAGRARIAVVGAAEAPVTPEVIEGYAAMGALASVKDLQALDGLPFDVTPDFRRACRPFGQNCGFTLAESAQVAILFDDALAVELGARVLGSVPDVFINADGYKKSIAGPGVGNYITLAKAAGAARSLLGEVALRQSGVVLAHGTGTPQNRVTESHIMSTTAAAFGIPAWPVLGIKGQLGHSLAAAAADQLMVALGVWEDAILPGIRTTTEIADDVHQEHLDFVLADRAVEPGAISHVLINSKGFGGNNASALVVGPQQTARMLQQRHGARAWAQWQASNAEVVGRAEAADTAVTAGCHAVRYRFDHGVLGETAIAFDEQATTLRVAGAAIALDTGLPGYRDMYSSDG